MITQNLRLNIFRFFSIIFIVYGFSYLNWRLQESINQDALIFSYTLLFAESLMFFGSLLMVINHWSIKKIKTRKNVCKLSHVKDVSDIEDRPVKIDIFIATYNEPLEIVEKTIVSAVKLKDYSKYFVLNIYLCDDGKRDGTDTQKENFKELADKFNINYFTRKDNTGFKAGNLNNAFWQTDGDFVVILDADTIAYPHFINNLMPYFKDQKMAWVQSPQYFYDIPKGRNLINLGNSKFTLIKGIAAIFPFLNKVKTGNDLLGTDPTIFYQVILYHRNSSNAAFCCGAGSIHRREALESLITDSKEDLLHLGSEVELSSPIILHKKLFEDSGNKCLGPFVHHISEDIYTSILLHSNKRKWKSYQHPVPECKMMSPQNLVAFDKQFSRYAEGTFSIFFSKNNPIIKRGLTLWQRIAYTETIYSYFSAFWIMIFLLSPIIFYFTLVPPLKAFSFDFFLRFIVLNFLSQLISLFAYWGISTNRSDQYFISSFWLKLRAFMKTIVGGELKFNTTLKSKEKSKFSQSLPLIAPHLLIVLFTLVGLCYNCFLIYYNQHPSISAFWANNIWAFYNIYQLSPIIRASLL